MGSGNSRATINEVAALKIAAHTAATPAPPSPSPGIGQAAVDDDMLSVQSDEGQDEQTNLEIRLEEMSVGGESEMSLGDHEVAGIKATPLEDLSVGWINEDDNHIPTDNLDNMNIMDGMEARMDKPKRTTEQSNEFRPANSSRPLVEEMPSALPKRDQVAEHDQATSSPSSQAKQHYRPLPREPDSGAQESLTTASPSAPTQATPYTQPQTKPLGLTNPNTPSPTHAMPTPTSHYDTNPPAYSPGDFSLSPMREQLSESPYQGDDLGLDGHALDGHGLAGYVADPATSLRSIRANIALQNLALEAEVMQLKKQLTMLEEVETQQPYMGMGQMGGAKRSKQKETYMQRGYAESKGEEDEAQEKQHQQHQQQQHQQLASGEWVEFLDGASQQYYYYNTATDEVTWDRPANFRRAKQKSRDKNKRVSSGEGRRRRRSSRKNGGSSRGSDKGEKDVEGEGEAREGEREKEREKEKKEKERERERKEKEREREGEREKQKAREREKQREREKEREKAAALMNERRQQPLKDVSERRKHSMSYDSGDDLEGSQERGRRMERERGGGNGLGRRSLSSGRRSLSKDRQSSDKSEGELEVGGAGVGGGREGARGRRSERGEGGRGRRGGGGGGGSSYSRSPSVERINPDGTNIKKKMEEQQVRKRASPKERDECARAKFRCSPAVPCPMPVAPIANLLPLL